MATLTRVQHNSMATTSTTATNFNTTLGSGVTAGNLLVATIVLGTNGLTLTAPSGWVQAGPTEVVSGSLDTRIYYLIVTSGGATSYNWSFGATAHSFGWTIDEWSSSTGWQASPVDSSAGNAHTSASTAIDCGSPSATTQASELWYGVLAWANSGQTLSGITSGWTTGDSAIFTSNNTQTAFFQNASSTGTPSLAATLSASNVNAGVVATFKPSALAVAGPPPAQPIAPGFQSPASLAFLAPGVPALPTPYTEGDPAAATGTGTAQAPVAQVTAQAGLASGTGTAQQPYVPPGAQLAHATGTALQPYVPPGAQAPAGTGTAQTPVAQVTAFAGLASGTGAAFNSNFGAPAATAAGAGTAQTPVAQVTAFAGLASGTGAALQVPAPAGLAHATGTALSPYVPPGAQLPSGTGTAQQPAASVTAFAGLASGTGAALQPNTPAGLAHGTGTAQQPVAQVTALAGLAHGAGAAGSPAFAPGLPHWAVTFAEQGLGAVLTSNAFGAALTEQKLGAALTTPNLGGSLVVASPSATCTIQGYGATLVTATLGAVMTEGSMQQASLTLSEFNDMTINIAVTNNGSPYNLTSQNLNLLLKSQAGVPDSQALIFSSTGGSPAITITNAAGGLATAQLPNASLSSEAYNFYRLDVVNASNQQQTTVYGPIIWVTL